MIFILSFADGDRALAWLPRLPSHRVLPVDGPETALSLMLAFPETVPGRPANDKDESAAPAGESPCVHAVRAQNARVLKLGRLLAPFLLAVLAGCGTAPQSRILEPLPELVTQPVAPKTNLPPPVVVQPPPPAPAPPTNPPVAPPAETWISLTGWAARHGFDSIHRTALQPPTFTLSTNRDRLVIAAGSQQARWDGTEILLGFPPRWAGGDLLVHSLDARKTLEPLLAPAPPLAGTNRVIVLDPGHGGMDTGAKSAADGRFEKQFTLDWARRLAPLLTAEGWTVFLTRTNDVEVPLAARVAFAERHKADLFVSLHFNSAYPHLDLCGLETYLLTPAGMPSNLTRGYGDDSSQKYPNIAFDAENLQLALRLHQALRAVNGSPDRGVRHARFLGVLRGQNRPAVLLEGGYLSNPQEARQIADPRYRQKLAEAVARALE